MLRCGRQLLTQHSSLVVPPLFRLAQRIGIPESGVDRLLRRAPCIRERNAQQLAETEELLRAGVGLRATDDLRSAVTASPAILCVDPNRISGIVHSLRLVTRLSDIGRCVARAPAILLLDADEVRQRAVAISAMNMDAADLVSRVPKILLLDTPSLQRLFAAFVLDRRGPLLHPGEVQSIFSEFPIVLSFNPEKTVFPLAETLRTRLGLDPASQVS
mmetsp:Transcript_56435/g.129563  ORF Transcript_56435/g.129563 Transcript_56435/m.129563 type:complete len:216 (+) Transcript_56435:706-1353(+)